MKFSITIPAYKRTYLKECIGSILAQTYTDFELIIVNDASPEDLDSIVNSFSDSRIRYYKNEKNCGAIDVVDNWNICLSYAIGDYVICMGDDDKLLPNCLEEYCKLITEYPGKGVYHAWTEIIDENSQLIRMQEARPIEENVYSLIWHRWHGREQFIGDFLFETKRLKGNGGFYKLPLAWGSDDITVVIAAQETGIVNSQTPIFQYRVNSQTISKSGNFELKLEAINKVEEWYSIFLTEPYENNRLLHIYNKMVKEEFKKAITKKKIDILSKDLIQGYPICKFISWISKKKKYNLSFKILLYSIIETLKRTNNK